MAFVNDTVLLANKALNGMESLARQARSYYDNPTMVRARQVAGSLANSAWVKGRALATSRPAMLGAGVGAAAGVGYNMYNNPRGSLGSRVRAGIKGGLLGGALGMGYRGYNDIGGPPGVRALIGDARTRMGAYGARARNAFNNRAYRAGLDMSGARQMGLNFSAVAPTGGPQMGLF